MSNLLSREIITEKVNKILVNRFMINPMFIDKNYQNENLLGNKFRMKSRDLLYLFFEIEKTFEINISEDDIIMGNFSNIAKIIDIIYTQLSQIS